MSEAYDELTETEKHIAHELGNGLDLMARLMNGPVSSEYFHGKFPGALRSFLKVAEMTGIDPDNPGIMHVGADAPDWDVHKVWDQVVRHESRMGTRLDQIWTALQYDNPYYQAEYPLSGGKPFFADRPRTLDDPQSTDWHVQYGTARAPRLINATVRGRSASDAVRNAYYVFPQATIVQINALKHDPDGDRDEYQHTVGWWAGVLSAVFGHAPRARCGEVLEATPDRPGPGPNAMACPDCRGIASA